MSEYVTLSDVSMNPVKWLLLLLEVCGNDTNAMIRKDQVSPLFDELTALVARAEASERVVDAAEDIADVLIRYAGTGHYQCRVCLAAELGKAITHEETCPVPEMQAALAAYDERRTEGGA